MNAEAEKCEQVYVTRNGFKAQVYYEHNGFFCGHVESENAINGFCMMYWDANGDVYGAHPEFSIEDFGGK